MNVMSIAILVYFKHAYPQNHYRAEFVRNALFAIRIKIGTLSSVIVLNKTAAAAAA